MKPAILLLILLAGSLRTHVAQSAPVELVRGPDPNGFELRLDMQPEIQVEASGRQLLLQFARPIDPDAFTALASAHADLFAGVSVGFDSVLLSFHVPVTHLPPARRDGKAVLGLARVSEPRAKSAIEESEDATRLALLRARLALETGQVDQGRRMLEELARAEPQDAKVLARLAEAEQQSGRWRRANELYGRAVDLEPENDLLRLGRDRLRRAEAPRLRLETDHVAVTGGETQTIVSTGGHGYVSEGLRVGFDAQHNRVEARIARRRDGSTAPFEASRQRAEIYLQHESTEGLRLRGSLLAGNQLPGAAVSLTVPHGGGETLFRLDFGRPYWDYLEALVDRGRRDRVELGRSQQLVPDLTGRIALAGNRYGLDGDPNVAQSVTLDGELSYTLLAGAPYLAAIYTLTGEYVTGSELRTTAAGAQFRTLPVITHEIHGVGLSASHELSSGWSVEATGLFTLDRYASTGYAVSLGSSYEVSDSVDVRLRASMGTSSTEAGALVKRLGGSLVVRF